MKIFFLLNGGRAPVSPVLISTFRTILDDAGADYRLEISRTLDEAAAFVEEARQTTYDTLWIGGGDGTINVLLNMVLPTTMTLGIVPMGTVNALARALGIPLDPAAAVRYLLDGAPRPMNIGSVNGQRRFLCFASIGYDAAVVHDVGGWFKRIGGRLAYLTAGLASVFRMNRLVPFSLEASVIDPAAADANSDLPTPAPVAGTGYSLVVSNIRNYAGFNLFPRAHPCAPAMEMWLFRHRRIPSMVAWSVASLLGQKTWQHGMRNNVGHYLVRNFTVASEKPMYLQLDGEAVTLGDGTRYEFLFHEAAVHVLTAPDAPGPLL